MKIALLYRHHKRCGQSYYKQALKSAGHEVVSMGPWQEDEPYGTKGREPDLMLGQSDSYNYLDLMDALKMSRDGFVPDMLWVIDGGEGMVLDDVTHAKIPWVHLSTEGARMNWSYGLTPHRFAEIMCNGVDEKVRWLPKAFDPMLSKAGPTLEKREYDFCMFASERIERRHVWSALRARGINCLVGDVWGSMHELGYSKSKSTYVCAGLDFVTTRTFEAMAAGCVVFADRNCSMMKMFEDGVHFVGYDPIVGESGELTVDADWLASQIRRVDEYQDIALEAKGLVWSRDTIMHRVNQVLGGIQ